MINLIPHCIVMGQAAGTAASLSLQSGVSVRKVNYGELQKSLAGQGVPLPDNVADTPPDSARVASHISG